MTSLFEARLFRFANTESKKTRNFPTFQVHSQTGSFIMKANVGLQVSGTKGLFLCISD